MINISKKTLYTHIIALTSIAFLTAPTLLHAQTQRVIIVDASGEIHAAPDMAILRLGVVNRADTAQKALSENNKAMNRVIDAFKKNGLDSKDIQTSNLSIYPIQQDRKDKKTKDTLYQISNTITIGIRDLNKAGKFFDEAVNLGINSVDNITFTNADQKAIYKKAREKAVIEAIEKANTLAKAAHVKLGSILKIQEGINTDGFRPMPVFLSASPSNNTASNFEGGELVYKARVSITFEIEQKLKILEE
ncbi:SIMPL domain-containing protein [Bartonella sp. DGB2]|uniref:SIMPL domain-containing protein n=1 Tax=Bartonella sp. DGB2 TaxID=3388426 RepID=UPI00398F9DD8